MKRVDLPDGQWLELRDPAEVTERQRRPHLAAVSVYMGTPDYSAARVDALRACNETAAIALINGWSFPEAVSAEAMQDWPSLRYDQVMSVIEPLADGLKWSLIVKPEATPETLADPKATTDA